MLKRNTKILISIFAALSVGLEGCGGSTDSSYIAPSVPTQPDPKKTTDPEPQPNAVTYATVLDELNQNEKTWNRNAPTDYLYTFKYFEPFVPYIDSNGNRVPPPEYVVEVAHGKIRQVFSMGDKKLVDLSKFGQSADKPLTIPELFEKGRTSLNTKDSVTDITYDWDKGFPTRISTASKVTTDSQQNWYASDLQNCTNKVHNNYSMPPPNTEGKAAVPTARIFTIDMDKLKNGPSKYTENFNSVVYGLAAKYGLTIKNLDAQKGTFTTDLFSDLVGLYNFIWCENLVKDENIEYTYPE